MSGVTVYVETQNEGFEEANSVSNVALEDGVLQLSFENGDIFMYNSNSWKTASVETGENYE